MGRMSREKGKRGEREFAAVCRANGYDGKRGVQYHGGPDSPDVTGLPGIHLEVKRTERLELYGAMAQAVADAGPNELPAVAHRRNHCDWLIIMRANDWFQLFREWEAGQ